MSSAKALETAAVDHWCAQIVAHSAGGALQLKEKGAAKEEEKEEEVPCCWSCAIEQYNSKQESSMPVTGSLSISIVIIILRLFTYFSQAEDKSHYIGKFTPPSLLAHGARHRLQQ